MCPALLYTYPCKYKPTCLWIKSKRKSLNIYIKIPKLDIVMYKHSPALRRQRQCLGK